MTTGELLALKHKVDRADRIRRSIDKVSLILKNIELGDCVSIDYRYKGAYDGSYGQSDEDEIYNYIQKITPEELGITEKAYSEWYTEIIRSNLKELKNKMVKEFEKLE